MKRIQNSATRPLCLAARHSNLLIGEMLHRRCRVERIEQTTSVVPTDPVYMLSRWFGKGGHRPSSASAVSNGALRASTSHRPGSTRREARTRQ
jgi:hypothetical protein